MTYKIPSTVTRRIDYDVEDNLRKVVYNRLTVPVAGTVYIKISTALKDPLNRLIREEIVPALSLKLDEYKFKNKNTWVFA
jgi:hypothetical protein